MDSRKEELERKKKRLEELRKTRDERQNELDKQKKLNKQTEEKFRERRQEVDSLVNEILSASPSKSQSDAKSNFIASPSPSPIPFHSSTLTDVTPLSEVDKAQGCSLTPAESRPLPAFKFVDLVFLDLKPKEHITYTKESQTDVLSLSPPTLATSLSTASSPNTSSPYSLDPLTKEDEKGKQEEVEREDKQNSNGKDPVLEPEVSKSLTEDEKNLILKSDGFSHFLRHCSHIMEKALSFSRQFDFLKDYSLHLHATGQSKDRNSAKLVNTFSFEKYTEGRTVTSIQWNPQFPELFLVAYSKSNRPTTHSEGLVLVWNLFLPTTPEFVLTCQGEVTTAIISPFHPNFIAAGTYSGQIVVWDTKKKTSNPSLKTPLSHSGHTHPITCARMIGTNTLHHLITSSNDGCICTWSLDLLSYPTESFHLVLPSPSSSSSSSSTTIPSSSSSATIPLSSTVTPTTMFTSSSPSLPLPSSSSNTSSLSSTVTSTSFPNSSLTSAPSMYAQELGVTCFAFASNETTQFYAGTDSGLLLHVQRYDRPGTPSGLVYHWQAHLSGITNIAFHPMTSLGPYDFSTLCLTSSLDWTVKLWKHSHLVYQFDLHHDYVLDVQWSPMHPAVFATCNSSGDIDVYNLNVDPEMFLLRIQVSSTSSSKDIGINKLCFDKEGRKIAAGTSDGKVYVYELDERFLPHDNDSILFQKTLTQFESMNDKRLINTLNA